MASKIKVDQIQTIDGTGTIALQNQLSGMTTASLPALGAAQMPAGSVLQVITAEDSSTLSLSSTTYTDTSLSAAITPSSSSSKILVFWSVHSRTQATNAGFGTKLLRGSTAIWTTAQPYYVYNTDTAHQRNSTEFKYLDSPSTTSAVTYKVQVSSHSGNLTSFNDNGNQSSILLMEIAG